MEEKGSNNPRQSNKYEEIDEVFVGDDARPVCPKCFRPCEPLQNYCPNCGSNEVINPLASYMPFVRIRFNIGMLCRLFFLVIIVLGAPIIPIVALPLLLMGKIPEPLLQEAAVISFYIILIILLALLIYFGFFMGVIAPVNVC